MLGCFYIVVIGAFALFEVFPVNYRPVLIEGVLEASYPSSTTMLALCVLPTAMLRLRSRWVRFLLAALTAFLVIGRLLCGVHWASDLIGGALLSAGLVTLYRCIISIYFSSKL